MMEINVGMLLTWPFENELKKLEFRGELTYVRTSGFLSSDFTICAEETVLQTLREWVDHINER